MRDEAIFCILGKHGQPTKITLDNSLLQITHFEGCDAERATIHDDCIEVALKEKDSLLLVGKR